MARPRRTYTPEFKAEAVRLVTEQGYSVAEAARSLGIHETLLRKGDPSHLFVDPNDPDGASSGLSFPSLVSCNNLFMIEQDSI